MRGRGGGHPQLVDLEKGAAMHDDIVRGFMDLFDGRVDAYGLGTGRVARLKGPYVYELLWYKRFRAHLRGVGPGLGVFPLLDDATCRFAAIDLDEPDFTAAFAMKHRIEAAHGAPAWVERSRSGNAHVWVFFSKRVPAFAVRALLREYAAAAGKPTVEIFPKQDRLGPGMVGNYINLPYHGDTRPIFNGLDLTYRLEDFVLKARSLRHDWRQWVERASLLDIGTGDPDTGLPPDWEPFEPREAVGAGERNNYLTSAAGMLFRAEAGDVDTVTDVLQDMNVESCEPPLPAAEVRKIARSVSRYHHDR